MSSRLTPSRPIPCRPIPCRPIPCRPIPCRPIPCARAALPVWRCLPACPAGRASGSPAVPGRAGGPVLEGDPPGGQLGADAIGLGEVLRLAGGVAGFDEAVDLVVTLTDRRAVVELEPQCSRQG